MKPNISHHRRHQRTGLLVAGLWLLLGPCLLTAQVTNNSTEEAAQLDPPFPIDEALVEAAGIERQVGRHLVLYSDIHQPQRSENLVAAFDAAVSQWCQVFGVEPEQAANWQMRAFLLADRSSVPRFTRAGLLPANLPDFAAGFQQDHDLWMFLQPGDYYTRHLLLHEGTHGFMQRFTGGYGAPWYSEGMAEQCGLHRWSDGKLQLQYRVTDRRQTPYWGRVRLIIDEHQAGMGLDLNEILGIPTGSFRNVRYYAWSWAGCEFFRHHPLAAEPFARLVGSTRQTPERFTADFHRELEEHWDVLARDWELFIDEMDYGYQVQRGRISPAQPAPFSGAWRVDSQKSWQQTGVAVEAGQRWQVTARGSYQVGQTISPTDPTKIWPWISQPPGISIAYHRGARLGRLQLGVLQIDAQSPAQQIEMLRQPSYPDSSGIWTAPADGWVCLRINDSPARLDDNQGALEVILKRLE